MDNVGLRGRAANYVKTKDPRKRGIGGNHEESVDHRRDRAGRFLLVGILAGEGI